MAFSVWKNNGLSLSPNFQPYLQYRLLMIRLLIPAASIRGFSDKALSIAETVIKDPAVMVPDYYADLYSFNKLFMTYQSDIVSRVRRKIRALSK